MVTCENCDEIFETTEDLDHDTVPELDTETGPPKIRIGTGRRDVWRCPDGGKTLGVR